MEKEPNLGHAHKTYDGKDGCMDEHMHSLRMEMYSWDLSWASANLGFFFPFLFLPAFFGNY